MFDPCLDAQPRLAGERALPSRRVLVGLLAFAVAIRLPTLWLHRLAEGDGVHYAQLARAILAGDLSGLANPYWSNLWPAVIALTSWLTRLDVVAAGRLASLLAGSLLVVVTALLASRIFGSTTGIAAGLLAAGHPWLVHFSTLLFTESFFTLLLMAVVLVAQRAVASNRAAAAAGVLAGLAAVTRPESYVVCAVVPAWLLVVAPRHGRRNAYRRGALFLFLVAAFVLGRAGVVHHYFELWDFGVGSKGTANLIVGLAETGREQERVATEVTPEGESRLSRASEETTVLGFAREHPGLLGRHVGRNLVLLLGCAIRVFPLVPLVGGRPAIRDGGWPLPLALLVLAACGLALFGLVRGWREPGSRRETSLLAALGALYLLGLAPLIVHDRLVVALTPLFLVFLAHGLVGAAWFLWRGSAVRLQQLVAVLLVLLAIVSLQRLLRASVLDYAGDPVVQREAGEWLRAHYAQTTRIMTASPSVGFYFYDAAHMENDLSLPWAECGRLIALARSQGVALLVVPEWHLRAVDHPAAPILLDPLNRAPDLRHVVTLGDEATGRMFIYELRPVADQAATPP
jgi:4-amino-4-deoxy-L-arabinose transferase-like glycosyltransferase